MKLKVLKKRDVYRVCESDGKLARSKHGKPVDGGGHADKAKAMRQVEHMREG